MEEGVLIQRIHDVLSMVEFNGSHEAFKHMKTCPCCGVFGPGQFGTKGIHKPDCELAIIKDLMTALLRQTDLDLHRDNMWYKLDTGRVGFNHPLIADSVSTVDRVHSTEHLMTSKG